MTATAAGGITGIERDQALALLHEMLRIRRFEEKAAELYSAGKIHGSLHLYIGEEAIAAGAIPMLRPDDAIVTTYREHGHALARGIPAAAVMAEMYGKANGCSRGRGGSMHLFDVGRRFYGGYAIVGGGLPIAVGLALADVLAHRARVTACFFGDGAVAEGEFHESLNLAALWRLPVVFVVEDNDWGISVPRDASTAVPSNADRAAAYGMPGERVEDNDVEAVWEAAGRAVARARAGDGPSLIEVHTLRLWGHFEGDAQGYRPELAEVPEHDPIPRYAAALTAAGILDDDGQPSVADAIAADPRLTADQKHTLLTVYESFLAQGGTEGRESPAAGSG